MKFDDFLQALMDMEEGTCPCESNIPCPFFEPKNEDAYCTNHCCVKGMEVLAKKILKNS